MATTKMEWSGMDKLVNLIARSPKEALKGFSIALANEALIAFRQSQREVPVKLGTLKGSGAIIPPSVVGDEVIVEVVYGGAAKKYAKIQHDNTSFRHPRGGKAFYLKDPVEARRNGFDKRVGMVVEAKIRGLL